MKIIRWILARIILFLDRAFSPKPRQRSLADQEKIKSALASYSIYQFEACPFCVKVRRYLRSEGVEVEYRDASRDPWRTELMQGGGKVQVPCLRIDNAQGSKWLYESNDIIAHFRELL